MAARALMFQGTGSDVGKSLIVAGLCRLFHKRGLKVRPFKPQNMSNNAAVTADGGEIGRAQALQARACGVAPFVHMNPVLLKPQTSLGAQVVVRGRVLRNATSREFQKLKPNLLPSVLESFACLREEADLVLVEGAGSASEINLRTNDIANMGFARAANVPVILVGDIDRGGVIGSLVGTHTVLGVQDNALVRGFVVNKMRGDSSLFADGMRFIAEHTRWCALGLVPFFEAARLLPAEDAYGLASSPEQRMGTRGLRIVVPLMPMIANFDDLDPLKLEPDVDLAMVKRGEHLPWPCDLVILPGSKATMADLAFLRAQGWDADLELHVKRGGRVLGLCGGYQMLGRWIADPFGLEGPPGASKGLGLLDIETELTREKTLCPMAGCSVATGAPLEGYEIHAGVTTGPDTAWPFARLDGGRLDGATSPDGRVSGTYLHGLFTHDRQRHAFLAQFGVSASAAYNETIEATLNALAAHLERYIDTETLLAMAE